MRTIEPGPPRTPFPVGARVSGFQACVLACQRCAGAGTTWNPALPAQRFPWLRVGAVCRAAHRVLPMSIYNLDRIASTSDLSSRVTSQVSFTKLSTMAWGCA